MALATNSTPGEVTLNGDIHGSTDALIPELTPTGVKAGTYTFPTIVVDTKGRLLSIETFPVDNVPCATALTCGIAKIGDYLTIVGDTASIPDASTILHGVVIVGDGIDVLGGVISIDTATASIVGLVSVGSGLGVDINGVLSRGGGVATTTSLGLVQISTGIAESSGIISVDAATNTGIGGVKSNDTTSITIDGTGGVDVGANISQLGTTTTFAASKNQSAVVVTDVNTSYTPDGSTSTVFDISLNGNTTLNAITNFSVGTGYDFIIRDNGHSLTLASDYLIRGTGTISGITIISCVCISGTVFNTITQPNFI